MQVARCRTLDVPSKHVGKFMKVLLFLRLSVITNSSSFNGEIFRQKSMLEKFRTNVLKVPLKRNFYILFYLLNL